MELKEMIVNVVYLSPDGLVPLKIVDEIAQKYGLETTTQHVLQVVKKNPQILVEDPKGKIKTPAKYQP
jgi:hypothetical protein